MTTELTLLSRVAYRGPEITSPRLRGLLALLAGDLRSGCTTARLVERLWPDEQPENPAKALQILVSRARAQLGAEVIATTPTGYRLALREEQVDTSAVLLRAAASARCARAGNHAAALALAWLGRHVEAAEALAGLARERPRDEEVLVELLRCEAATVGPSAALARYEAYRRSLRDELLSAFRNKQAPPVHARAGRRALALAYAIIHSFEAGTRVDVPPDADTLK